MKIGIVTTHHCSKSFSPDGDKFTNRLIDSLKSINYDYVMYLYDNQSTVPFVENNKINDRIKYKYIEDQSKRGITGTWNDGFYDAYTDNYFHIFNSFYKNFVCISILLIFDEKTKWLIQLKTYNLVFYI